MRSDLAVRLKNLKFGIVEIGIFVLFIVTFGDYLVRKVWPILQPALSAMGVFVK